MIPASFAVTNVSPRRSPNMNNVRISTRVLVSIWRQRRLIGATWKRGIAAPCQFECFGPGAGGAHDQWPPKRRSALSAAAASGIQLEGVRLVRSEFDKNSTA